MEVLKGRSGSDGCSHSVAASLGAEANATGWVDTVGCSGHNSALDWAAGAGEEGCPGGAVLLPRTVGGAASGGVAGAGTGGGMVLSRTTGSAEVWAGVEAASSGG